MNCVGKMMTNTENGFSQKRTRISSSNIVVILMAAFSFALGYVSFSLKYIVLAIALVIMLFYFGMNVKVFRLQRSSTYYFLFVAWSAITILWCGNATGVTTVAIWIIAYIVFLYFSRSERAIYSFRNYALLFTGIHAIAIIVQFLAPSVIYSVNSVLLDPVSFAWNQRFYSIKAYAGLCMQTGTAAFYLSILAGILFVRILLFAKQRIANTCIFAVSLMLILMTQKRALFVFCCLGVLLIYLIYEKASFKKIAVLVFGLTFTYIVLSFVLSNTEFGSVFLNKALNGNYGDVFSSRLDIYTILLDSVNDNIIFGHGLGSSSAVLMSVNESQGHLIYLQVLYESGIIGLLLLLLFLSSVFIKTYSMIKQENCDLYEKELLFNSLFIQFIILMWGFTGNPLYDHFIWFIYMIFASTPYAINKKNQKG